MFGGGILEVLAWEQQSSIIYGHELQYRQNDCYLLCGSVILQKEINLFFREELGNEIINHASDLSAITKYTRWYM